MIPQYLFRRQCLVLLIFIGSLLSLYIILSRYYVVFGRASNRVYERGRLAGTAPPRSIGRNKVGRFSNGRKLIKHVEGVVNGVGCAVKNIDPFSEEVMKYMHDFGQHKCPYEKDDVQVTVVSSNITLVGNDLDFVRIREISDDAKDGFLFKEFSYLEKPLHVVSAIQRNHSGAIRNVASKRCIFPKYELGHPSPEIEVMFSTECTADVVKFTFTPDGLIRHKLTSKCLGPKGGAENPPDNTEIVISDNCEFKFNVLHNGVLQLAAENPTMCIHPLWGGNVPTEGQHLCLYASCGAEARLSYNWFVKFAGKNRGTNKQYPLASDMNHVQVQLLNEKMINKYILAVVQKVPPTVPPPSAKPNIIIICLEDASAAHFKRKLQFTNVAMSKMGFKEYKMYAGVSPSSAINFLTMLQGHSNSAVGSEDSLFGLAKKANYTTMLSADDPLIISTMEKGQDIHHNSLPFFRMLKKHYNVYSQGYCVTGQPIYDVTFHYLRSFINSYPSQAKLAVILLSEIGRYNFNHLGYMDKNFMDLLEYLRSLKNTIVFIKTLKGAETGKLAQLEQGIDEIKRPLLATYVSEDIRDKHKFEMTRLNQLSTPFDIYVTLSHLISQKAKKHKQGKSLLDKVKPRNCLEANIYPLMCPCV